MIDFREPQRFKYRMEADSPCLFCVCMPVIDLAGNYCWRIIDELGESIEFEESPFEVIGVFLGDIESLWWLDNDYGWGD